jgi:hypothetical protein
LIVQHALISRSAVHPFAAIGADQLNNGTPAKNFSDLRALALASPRIFSHRGQFVRAEKDRVRDVPHVTDTRHPVGCGDVGSGTGGTTSETAESSVARKAFYGRAERGAPPGVKVDAATVKAPARKRHPR